MMYVLKLAANHPANVMIMTVAMPYDMKGYVPWDAIKYNDNVVDVSDEVSEEVEKAWIAGSMWGWHVPGAKAARDYVADNSAALMARATEYRSAEAS